MLKNSGRPHEPNCGHPCHSQTSPTELHYDTPAEKVMIAGPIPLRVVAAFLGKDEAAIPSLVEQDGLPVVPINTAKKPVMKVFFLPLLRWINGRAVNEAMTADDLEQELERCERHLAAKDKAKKERAAAK